MGAPSRKPRAVACRQHAVTRMRPRSRKLLLQEDALYDLVFRTEGIQRQASQIADLLSGFSE